MTHKPVVLVTGGSRGLGVAIVKLLLSGSTSAGGAGIPPSRVVTISRTVSDELSSLQSRHADSLVCVEGDVTSASVNAEAVKAAVSKFGGLDAVVLNAGVMATERIADQSPTAFADMLNINTVSLITTLSASLPQLGRAPRGVGGRVVFVSSGAATGNTAGWGAYNATKAAMNAICRTLANEEESIACFAVRPGVIDTDMQTNLRATGAAAMKQAELDRFLDLHKEGKLLKPEQPAWSIAALATRGSRIEPKGSDGKGLGEVGALVTWNDDLLDGFRNV